MCVSCLEHFVNCSIYSLAELETQQAVEKHLKLV